LPSTPSLMDFGEAMRARATVDPGGSRFGRASEVYATSKAARSLQIQRIRAVSGIWLGVSSLIRLASTSSTCMLEKGKGGEKGREQVCVCVCVCVASVWGWGVRGIVCACVCACVLDAKKGKINDRGWKVTRCTKSASPRPACDV